MTPTNTPKLEEVRILLVGGPKHGQTEVVAADAKTYYHPAGYVYSNNRRPYSVSGGSRTFDRKDLSKTVRIFYYVASLN